eukprot:547478_1
MAETMGSGLSIEAPLVSKTSKKGVCIFSKTRIIICTLFVIFTLIAASMGLYYYFTTDESTKIDSAGLSGLWPVWGGGLLNQQRAPDDTIVNRNNIEFVSMQCTYNSLSASEMTGYITIDETGDYGYWTDNSGYVTSINLDSCETKWRVNINEILNVTSTNLRSANGVTLFRDSNGINGVLVATPELQVLTDTAYAFALHQQNGSLLWKLPIHPSIGGGDSYITLKIHGFMVDGHFAFGGLVSHSMCMCKFRGRMLKIDIDTGELVDIWYTIPEYTDTENHDYYAGASPWNYGAIGRNYLVFGSGNVYEIPHSIEQCMMFNGSDEDNIYIPENNYPFNLCGEDMSSQYPHWKCYDKNIHSDSLNILDKDSMKLIKSIPMSGVDIYKSFCNLWTDEFDDERCPHKSTLGPDADLTAIALYRDKHELYAACISKGGVFMVASIPNGEVKVVKKVGPSWNNGGGLYSMAVDQKSMIAIASITGGQRVRYKDANGRYICHSGSIHAIDLKTGYTIWQSINPYGLFDESCLNDSQYDGYFDFYNDRYGICEFAFGGTEMKLPNETMINEVIYADLNDDTFLPINYVARSYQISPVTIVGDMVFVPNFNGDIFIHDLLNGNILGRLQCDDYFDGVWNRPGIFGGVTVVRDRIVWYCGGGYGTGNQGNTVVSMKLVNITDL